MEIGALVPNTHGHRDIRKFLMPVSELGQKSGYRFQLPASVVNQSFDSKRWPTRMVKGEGYDPDIERACPRVGP